MARIEGGRQNPARQRLIIKSGEKKLDELHRELGKKTYELMLQGRLDSPELAGMKEQIDAVAGELESNRQLLDDMKAHKQAARGMSCPNCSVKTPPGSVVCPYCGMQLVAVQQQAPAADAPVPVAPPAGEMVLCLHCGGEISAEAGFCGLCGEKVVAQINEGIQVQDAPPEPPGQVAQEAPAPEPPAAAVPAPEPPPVVPPPAVSPPPTAEAVKPPPPPPMPEAPASPQVKPPEPPPAVPPPPSPAKVAGSHDTSLREPGGRQAPPAPAPQAEAAAEKHDTGLREKTPAEPVAEPADSLRGLVPEKKTCRNCGETQRPEAVFCFNCGESLKE